MTRTIIESSNSRSTAADIPKPPAAQNAPLLLKRPGLDHYGFDPRRAVALRLMHADKTRNFIVGPMPVRIFLDDFFPNKPSRRMPHSRKAFMIVPKDGSEEELIYKPLVCAAEKCHASGIANISLDP